MFLRLTSGRIKKGSEAKARRFYRDESIPALVRRRGFLFARLLENADGSGEFISVTAWATPGAADAYEKSGLYRQLVSKFQPCLEGRPRLKCYKVTVDTQAK